MMLLDRLDEIDRLLVLCILGLERRQGPLRCRQVPANPDDEVSRVLLWNRLLRLAVMIERLCLMLSMLLGGLRLVAEDFVISPEVRLIFRNECVARKSYGDSKQRKI